MGEFEKAEQKQQQVGQRQQSILDLAQNLSTGQQRGLKKFLQGDILYQLGTDMGSLRGIGQNTASAIIAGGYDRRSAFGYMPNLEAPKAVDYETIRKDFMSQLNEFVVPKGKTPTSTQQQQVVMTGVQQEVAAMREKLEAHMAKAKPSVDQKNTFNIHLPVGSTEDQAKSLEEPLIKLQIAFHLTHLRTAKPLSPGSNPGAAFKHFPINLNLGKPLRLFRLVPFCSGIAQIVSELFRDLYQVAFIRSIFIISVSPRPERRERQS